MPSFDVVSEVDMHEVNNAVDQANREISNRYDLKGTGAEISVEGETLTLKGQAEFQIKQVMDLLLRKLTSRGVDVQCLEEGTVEQVSKMARQRVTVRQGIDRDTAGKLVRKIKDTKIKVQTAIQGEKLRVTGKKRDDLQRVIAMMREEKVDLPLQYENFRD
ncbi:MAG: YajQ family cyclic di-GMP-binding protein [Pseudomonadota bacterium]|nr:YajQ family cyclic di-GMP-binding protein [Pseudomonadota bacterium]